MDVEHALVLFLLMLIAQVPILIAAAVAYLKNRVAILAAREAAETAAKKAQVVETKIDDNTAKTESVNVKADTIVEQTNGTLDAVKNLVKTLAERVAKLEDYNHSTAHRLLNALNDVHLKVAEMVALQPKPVFPENRVPRVDAGERSGG